MESLIGEETPCHEAIEAFRDKFTQTVPNDTLKMLKSKSLWTNEKRICLAFPGMWLTPSFWISHYEGMNVLRSYTQKLGKLQSKIQII